MEEYLSRFEIFRANYLAMENFSYSEDRSYTIGITQFSDMTTEEFRSTMLTLKTENLQTLKSSSKFLHLFEDNAPESLDWRTEGAVTPVKNQGSCGSCWAFSTTGNLEGVYYVKHKELKEFSEQQLVDCDTKEDQGCNGGLMENAYKYIEEAGGLESESDYPYEGRDRSCRSKKDKAAVKVSSYKFAPSEDENEIKTFLANVGPLAVALNANPLQWYSRGIVDESHSSCDPAGLNHGVLIVGYGSEKGKDYWIVKNSWGKGWGENGYFRMARGKGTCGINTYVVTAEVE